MSMSAAEIAEIISNTSDPRNMYHGGSDYWFSFIDNICCSIRNRSLSKLPLAQLNANGSISFLLEKSPTSRAKDFESAFDEPYILEQLEYHRKKLGFPLTEGGEQLMEKNDDTIETTGIIQYRINLSPEHLDAILKLANMYAYRSEASILTLRNQMTLKPGVICLFPVASLGEKSFAMRVAGCQTAEIPSVQLLRILPGFNGIEPYFHWEVPEVEARLAINRSTIESVLNEVLKSHGMLPGGNNLYIQSLEGFDVLKEPTSPDGDLRIVDMSPEARQIYLTYGNVGSEEIDECKSVEISTIEFLNVIRRINLVASELIPKESKYKDDRIRLQILNDSIPLIDDMIKIEEQKRPAAGAESAAAACKAVCQTAKEALQAAKAKTEAGPGDLSDLPALGKPPV